MTKFSIFIRTILVGFVLLFLSACGGYKTQRNYTKNLAASPKIAVLTPYADVEELYLANDFKQEKQTLDTIGIEKGKQAIQKKTIEGLPPTLNPYPVQLTQEFQQKSKADVLLMLKELDKNSLKDVIMPAYVKELLKQKQLATVVLLYHIGSYKSSRRNKQDEVVYNTKQALDGIFSAGSPTNSSAPNFPDDAISVLHLVIYDVKEEKFLYYDNETNFEVSEPDVPIPAEAVDNQLKELLKKLKKDLH